MVLVLEFRPALVELEDRKTRVFGHRLISLAGASDNGKPSDRDSTVQNASNLALSSPFRAAGRGLELRRLQLNCAVWHLSNDRRGKPGGAWRAAPEDRGHRRPAAKTGT